MEISPTEFRQAMSRFATGVCVATTTDQDLRPVGITINSFSSVSLKPPLVLFSLSRTAQCFPVFAHTQHFTFNILSKEQQHLSERFSKIQLDKWQGVPYQLGTNGCPFFEESLEAIECRVYARYDGGDHEIIMGEVTKLLLPDITGKNALLYATGQYREINLS